MKRCTRCGQEKPLSDFARRSGRLSQVQSNCKVCQVDQVREWRSRNPGRAEAANRQWIAINRRAVLEHYSGGEPHCACCGETEFVFLALDHINDDGYLERSQAGYSRAGFWSGLIRRGFPSGYQVLCHNCNWAKSHGGCPHQAGVEDGEACVPMVRR